MASALQSEVGLRSTTADRATRLPTPRGSRATEAIDFRDTLAGARRPAGNATEAEQTPADSKVAAKPAETERAAADETASAQGEADEATAVDEGEDETTDQATEAADVVGEQPISLDPAESTEAADTAGDPVEAELSAEDGEVDPATPPTPATVPMSESKPDPAVLDGAEAVKTGGAASDKATAGQPTPATPGAPADPAEAEPALPATNAAKATAPETPGTKPATDAEATVSTKVDAGDSPAPAQAAAKGVVEIGSISSDASSPEVTAPEVRPTVSAPKTAEPLPVARGLLAEENVEQVVASVRNGLAGGKSRHEMTVRLDPPSLGSMRIRMEMIEGQVTATFSTSSEVTHRLMQQSMQHLRASLEQAGFSVDRLQVQRAPEVSGGQGSFLQNESGGEGREQMQHQQREKQRRETLIRLWRAGSWSERQINLTA